MKKGLIGAVIAAVVLMVLFPACGPSEVKIVELTKSSAPSSVSASCTSRILTLKWEAADNATKYYIVGQQKDVKDIIWTDSIDPSDAFSTSSGLTKSGNVYTYIYNLQSYDISSAGSYRFGINARSYNGMQESDIVWSDYVTVAAAP